MPAWQMSLSVSSVWSTAPAGFPLHSVHAGEGRLGLHSFLPSPTPEMCGLTYTGHHQPGEGLCVY